MTIDDIQALPFHLRVTIPKDYLDIFEHMNVQYYLKIFNDSVFHMKDTIVKYFEIILHIHVFKNIKIIFRDCDAQMEG